MDLVLLFFLFPFVIKLSFVLFLAESLTPDLCLGHPLIQLRHENNLVKVINDLSPEILYSLNTVKLVTKHLINLPNTCKYALAEIRSSGVRASHKYWP